MTVFDPFDHFAGRTGRQTRVVARTPVRLKPDTQSGTKTLPRTTAPKPATPQVVEPSPYAGMTPTQMRRAKAKAAKARKSDEKTAKQHRRHPKPKDANVATG